jgi:hypothetical protein
MCIRAQLAKDTVQMTKTGIIHFFLFAHAIFDGDFSQKPTSMTANTSAIVPSIACDP